MDTITKILREFFDSLPPIYLPEMPHWLFWQIEIVTLTVIVWTSYLFLKRCGWESGQQRFVVPPHLGQKPIQASRRRSAEIIDFASARQRAQNLKRLRSHELVDKAVAEELNALRGSGRDSFDFSKFQKEPGGDNDPEAA